MKKILTYLLSIVMVAALAITGTIAYLQDDDSDVNVMTLGNVQIDQIEQQRDENGVLEDFEQDKPAYPAVGPVEWADEKLDVNGTGYKVFTEDLKNVVDKIVTVKNTGKSDAFIRTIVAIEAPEGDPKDLIHINYNGIDVTIASTTKIFIDEVEYLVLEFVYANPLKAGEISAPSLMQVFLDSITTNEDVAKFGETWEILVASQAVQTNGFADALTALDTAFGDITAENHPWVKKYDHVVTNFKELKEACEKGGKIKLANDIELEGVLYVPRGTEVYLDMNGKKLSANDSAADPAFYTYKYSKLTIDGNGTVELSDPFMSLLIPGGDVVIENGTFIRNVPVGTAAQQVGALFVGVNVSPWGSQSVVINGGYFDGGYYDTNAADIEGILAGTIEFVETANDIAKRGVSSDANVVRVALRNNVSKTLNISANLMKVNGGTFVGMNPAWGDEGCMLPTSPNYLRPWSYYQGALIEGQVFNADGIKLPEGCTITKGVLEDGRPTYTVNYNK